MKTQWREELWNKIDWCMCELEQERLSRAFHVADNLVLKTAGRGGSRQESVTVLEEGVCSLFWMKVKTLWRKVAGHAGWGRVGLVNSSRLEKGWVNGRRRGLTQPAGCRGGEKSDSRWSECVGSCKGGGEGGGVEGAACVSGRVDMNG